MISFGPGLAGRKFLRVLLLVAASFAAPATFVASSTPTGSAEQVHAVPANESSPRVADEAYGTSNLQLPHVFLQPVPVILTGLHETVSPGMRHVRSVVPGGVPAFDLADSPPAAEAPCLDTEGRDRYCWLKTYRC